MSNADTDPRKVKDSLEVCKRPLPDVGCGEIQRPNPPPPSDFTT